MTHRFGRLADSEEALSAGANSSVEGAAAIEGDLVARAQFLSELGPGEMPSRQDFDFSTLLSSGAYVVPSSHLPTSVVSCFFFACSHPIVCACAKFVLDATYSLLAKTAR